MNIQSLDSQFLLLINHGTANPLFDILMPALSSQGYLLILPFLFFIVIVGGTRGKDPRGNTYLSAALWAIAIACGAAFLADWAEHLLKNAVMRARPCHVIEGIRLITACPKSYSMPSGHAISSFAFTTPLVYLTRREIAGAWRPYPLLLASLIAFSRLYLGVHYPTDVLAGAVLGTVIGLGLSFLYQAIVSAEVMKKYRR